jgi:2-polyprenyl-3-methyl-5-hydroxy-6-metoxy-1,4-benzoquinol methylase
MNKQFTFSGYKVVTRHNACSVCDNKQGLLVGLINYIGLAQYDMLQCPGCGLVSCDPLPSEEITQKGCDLLYRIQQNNLTKNKIMRGFKRSYRRGGYFAREYLSKIFDRKKELSILELGAGDGYFSQGIGNHFKNAKITYMDIVPDLLKYYKEHFPCDTISCDLDKIESCSKKFDLIIARDLVEHLLNPMDFFKMANRVLSKEGIVFFITPNGREDFWHCNQRFLKKGEPLIIHLNHFHYFLPETLDQMLGKNGLKKYRAFKFGLKRYKQGYGHKEMNEFPVQDLPSNENALKQTKPVNECFKHNHNQIISSFLHGNTFLAKLYSKLVDKEKDVVDYYAPMGHEFFVIAKRDN